MRDAVSSQPTLAAALVEGEPAPVVVGLTRDGVGPDGAAGIEQILEGFLLHHRASRHFEAEGATAILGGDYCYAHGLVTVAEQGDLTVIRLLADLIALSVSAVATEDDAALQALWRATCAALASGDPAQEAILEAAKEELRQGDSSALIALAATMDPTPDLDRVLAHA